MNRQWIIWSAMLLLAIAIIFTIDKPAGSNVASAESLRESIKESMKETEERRKTLEKFHLEVNDTFDEKGYEGSIAFSMDNLFSSNPLEIIVQVKDRTHKNDHGKDMKQMIEDAAKAHQIGEVNIHFKVVDMKNDMSQEDKKLQKLSRDIIDITREVLDQNGYKYNGMSIDPRSPSPTLEVRIEGTKEEYKQKKDEIEKLVHDAIHSRKELDYTVKVTRKTEEQMKEEKWHPIFQSINDETKKQFNKVTGFAYSFHPAPLQIIIKTSLSQNPDSKKQVNQIERYVHEIIDIKIEALAVEEEPYKIIIRGKNRGKLN